MSPLTSTATNSAKVRFKLK
jgi:hypothetical protein